MTLPHYPMDHAQGRASKGTKVDSRSRSSVPFRHPSLIHHICFSTAAPCQRHVHRSGANRARNSEQPRSVKKGSTSAAVRLRGADRQEGNLLIYMNNVDALQKGAARKESQRRTPALCADEKVQPSENWMRCVRHEVA